ncbi:hypothetical protein BH10BDE1_BH10BDE1_05300 [soil metagenome]
MIVLAMVLATQASRLSPLALGRMKISPEFERWLTHVPIAILTALVVPEFFGDVNGVTSVNWMFVAAGAACFVVGYLSRSLLLTTFVGIACAALARVAG